MTSISIAWDINLNPEDVDAASKKVAQKATFEKFVVSNVKPTASTIKIAI